MVTSGTGAGLCALPRKGGKDVIFPEPCAIPDCDTGGLFASLKRHMYYEVLCRLRSCLLTLTVAGCGFEFKGPRKLPPMGSFRGPGFESSREGQIFDGYADGSLKIWCMLHILYCYPWRLSVPVFRSSVQTPEDLSSMRYGWSRDT